MIDVRKFIERLNKEQSNYTSPELSQNIANALESLSTDIYTDSKRFIYEMLQNADDASNRSGKLEIQIQIIGQYLVISHQGEKFTEIDIESICSVGDGNKKGDENKTGFKGIGFKSIFSHSDYVIINSGDYCFSFDKNHWENYWSNNWGKQQDWKKQRVSKGKEANVKMPWQIIPIWTYLPKELAFVKKFNVSTIVKYDDIEKLHKELFDLFSNTQILLFLRSREVKVTITKAVSFTIEKVRHGETIKLRKNGQDISEWLFKSVPLDVDQLTKNIMENDIRIPKKLRQSNKTEIFFAVQLEDGKIKTADKENRLIFTYLPTSVNYDFPFLVNASFLTDAGRQHLHEDLYWNIWLFQQIPIYLFGWLSQLAKSKYKNEILKLIPHKFRGHSQLQLSFNKGLEKAISEIAFIPNKQGDLLKVSDAIWDKTNISECIQQNIIINYINLTKSKQFSEFALIPSLQPMFKLQELALEIFDIDDLEGFFSSSLFQNQHHINENFALISFLCKKLTRDLSKEEKDVWQYKIQFISFIFNENGILKNPKQIYFPGVKFSDSFQDSISIVHPEIIRQIEINHHIKVWLESLGVKEPTDISFIEKTIIGNEDYCNRENAIEVGRYLFNAHKKGILNDQHYNDMQHINLLTKKNNLVKAQDAFLSNFYEPELLLESICMDDFFVSNNYYIDSDLKSEWKTFFLKIGVNENIKLQRITDNKNSKLVESEYFYFVCSHARDKANKANYYPALVREDNLVTFDRIAYTKLAKVYGFSKLFWKQVFRYINPDSVNKIAHLHWGYYGSTWDVQNYFHWSLENSEIIPTKTGKCLKCKDVFINHKEIKDIAGKYLPVFDYEGIIPQKWLEYLPFKSNLTLDDFLLILSEISKDVSTDQNLNQENNKRIIQIYNKLADDYLGYVDRLKNWGKQNKILSKDGKTFLYPSELSIVTVKGFKAPNLAFWDENNKKVIELLKIFGVSVIDKIKPDISNPVKRQDLINKLREILPLIVVVVSIEESKSKKYWDTDKYSRLRDQLNSIVFFEASEIYLSYGNAEDKQKSSSYSDGNNFYYVGKWNKPRVLDSLVEPLGKFLGIEYGERHLSVLLSDTFEEGIEYLKEKFGDNVIDDIPIEFRKPPEIGQDSLGTTSIDHNDNSNDFIYDDDGLTSRELAEKYGKIGKNSAKMFYYSQGYEVIDSSESGYDLVCTKAGESLKVEVKAIDFTRPNIRFTEREWEKMAKYKDIYELFIFGHNEGEPKDIIRLRRAGLTIQEVLSTLPNTTSRYSSGKIEFLIGLQLNESELGNDIMFKWHRLLKNASHDAIEKYEYDNATSTFHRIS